METFAITHPTRMKRLKWYIKQLKPVVYYPLFERTGSASVNHSPLTKNSFNGVITGATLDQNGIVGKTYRFDGDDKVQVTTGTGVDSLTTCSFHILFNATNWSSGSGFPRLLQKGPNAVGYVDILVSDSANSFIYQRDYATNDKQVTIAEPSTATWYSLVITDSGADAASSVNIYLNGVLQTPSSTQDGTGGITADSNAMTISNRTSDTARGFAGLSGHVAVFNKVLTAAQAARLAKIAGLA